MIAAADLRVLHAVRRQALAAVHQEVRLLVVPRHFHSLLSHHDAQRRRHLKAQNAASCQLTCHETQVS